MSETARILLGRAAAVTLAQDRAPPVRRPPRRLRASAGLVVVRRSARGAPELLLVHKRYTFAYAEFVHGRYSMRRNGGDGAACYEDLLRDMTVEELLLVHSLDFARMWYHVWLDGADQGLYLRKLARFQSCFLGDGGVRLRRALAAIVPAGATLWEPPKGRIGARETALGAAVRELAEEAGVEKSAYTLLPGVTRRLVHVSGGVRYETTYFVAAAGPRLTATGGAGRPPLRDLVASFRPRAWDEGDDYWGAAAGAAADPTPRATVGAGASRCAEISEARWFDTNAVAAIAASGAAASADLLRLARAAFNLFRAWERGSLGAQRSRT